MSLIVAILILVFAGTVLAATAIMVPAQVNVVAATYDIQVYSDMPAPYPSRTLYGIRIYHKGERGIGLSISKIWATWTL